MDHQYDKRGYLLEDFRLFHLMDAPKSSIDFHYHEFHKILLLVSGNGCYSVNGNRYGLNSGDMVLVGSRTVHRPEFDAPYERVILYISPEFLRLSSTPQCSLDQVFSGEQSHVIRANKTISALAEDLEHELSTNGFGSDIAAKGLILKLLVEIRRAQLNKEHAPSSLLTPKNERIYRLTQFIDSHLSEELSIDILAEGSYLSKYHLMRLFREHTGTTIHAYITDRRLLLARDLISKGMNATEACYHTGFKSYSAFTRAYAKRFGTTPTGRKDRSALAEETYE